jgi:hypothetical protein
MSKQVMADELGISKRGILMILERMISEGFLVKNEETKFYRTTEKWNGVYHFEGGEKSAPLVKNLHSSGEKSAPLAGEKSAPNNNILDNNNIINKSEDLIFESLLEKSSKIFSEAGIRGHFISKMKQLYSISDVEVNRLFLAWKKENEATCTEFKNDQHLRNSFNAFIKKAKGSGGKTGFVPDTPMRVKAGRMI